MTRWSVVAVLLALSATASSQARVRVQRIRLSEELSYSMADRKVLPEITDLKGHKLNAEVAVVIVISKSGDVTDARAAKGDAALFKRSEEAALRWHYRPYLLNGIPI